MADFDIEAYLEEQVVRGKDETREDKKNSKESSEAISDDRRDSDRHRDRPDRERQDRDRERDRGRESSRDRRRRRDDSSERRRSRSRDRRRSRSRSSSRRRRRGDSRDRRRTTKEEPPKVEKPVNDPQAFLDRYQIEYEREKKRLEEEAKRIEEEKQREIDDLTKDQRTIFVGQLTMKVQESNLKEFFSQIGNVKSVIMIRDKNTGKHKGFGYVEMAELSSIPSCLLFNNVVPDFQKFPILVKASEAEKNLVAKKDSISRTVGILDTGLDPRVYIGNIHVNVDEDSIRAIAEQFGPIDNITLHRDELGNSKGYCFVRYRSVDSAQMAMTGLSGMEVMGRPLKVGPVLDNSSKSISSVQEALSGDNDMLPNGQLSTINWKLDDDDGSRGMQLSSQSRHMLMTKLAQGAGLTVPTAPILPAVPYIAPSSNTSNNNSKPPITGTASRAFMMSNMFDLSKETQPNWDQDIREEVMDECRKFGSVENVVVETKKPGGIVYVKFSNVDASVKAAQSLHGRYFAGKMITVSYIDGNSNLFNSK